MNNSLHKLSESIRNLEELVQNKTNIWNSSDSGSEKLLSKKIEDLKSENHNLKQELEELKHNYKILKDTSRDVINELNHSIQVIEDYFKKENANN